MKKKETLLKNITRQIKTGKTPPTNRSEYFGGEINFYTPSDLTNSIYLGKSNRTISRKAVEDNKATIFEKDTILISCIGDIGKLGIVTERSSANQQLTGIVLNDEVNPLYFYYYCKRFKSVFEKQSNSAIVSILNNELLSKIKVTIHESLPEQIRIANVLSQAEALLAQRKESLALLDAYLKSVFLEMFGDPVRNEKGWDVKSLEHSILIKPQNGLYKHQSSYGKGTKIIRIDSFYDSYVQKIENLKQLELEEKEIQLYKVEKDDILINRVNSIEYLGKIGVVPEIHETIVFESNVMRFKLKEDSLNPIFLMFLWRTKFIKDQIKKRSKNAVNQSSINQQDVQAFLVILPPLDLQNQFAGIMEKVEALKEKYEKSLRELEALYGSLSQRAFRGEL